MGQANLLSKLALYEEPGLHNLALFKGFLPDASEDRRGNLQDKARKQHLASGKMYTWQVVDHVDEAGGGGVLTHRRSCWLKLGLGLAAERLGAHAAGQLSQGLSPLSPGRTTIIVIIYLLSPARTAFHQEGYSSTCQSSR